MVEPAERSRWVFPGVGWDVSVTPGRGADHARAGDGVDIVILAVPDTAVRSVAEAIDPTDAVLCHLAGSLGLDVLARHARRTALHPLVALPDAEIGAQRLTGAWFAVAGDEVAADRGDGARRAQLRHRRPRPSRLPRGGGHRVEPPGRARWDRSSGCPAGVGAPRSAMIDLARGSLDNVASIGAAAALTGPVARGDEATVERHRAALPDDERALYDALADAARRLVEERDAHA